MCSLLDPIKLQRPECARQLRHQFTVTSMIRKPSCFLRCKHLNNNKQEAVTIYRMNAWKTSRHKSVPGSGWMQIPGDPALLFWRWQALKPHGQWLVLHPEELEELLSKWSAVTSFQNINNHHISYWCSVFDSKPLLLLKLYIETLYWIWFLS